jgi:hypothetical protein
MQELAPHPIGILEYLEFRYRCGRIGNDLRRVYLIDRSYSLTTPAGTE